MQKEELGNDYIAHYVRDWGAKRRIQRREFDSILIAFSLAKFFTP